MSKIIYNEQDTESQFVNEPMASYGNIDALKNRLVKRIMEMDKLKEVRSVLDFVERRNAISGEELLNRLRPRIKTLFK